MMSSAAPPFNEMDVEAQARINAACNDLAAAWPKVSSEERAGLLSAFLRQAKGPEERRQLLLELVIKDLELRSTAGAESPRAEEYLRRFPDEADVIAAAFREASESGDQSAGPATATNVQTPSQQAESVRRALAVDGKLPDIPGYEMLEELGRGGMGVVYLAVQTNLNRRVALKMIRAGISGEELTVRFKAEADALARLQHPNFVQVYDVGVHNGERYLTLEYVEGESLDKKLNGTPQPPAESAALIEVLARAMQQAHELGIVHRDLKPGNILIKDEGGRRKEEDNQMQGGSSFILHSSSLKITDFGLAKTGDSNLTVSGAVMGTPQYMSPEQADGIKNVGPAADVYSLGVILYQLLTGRVPFKGTNPLDTMDLLRTVEPVPPRDFQPKVPRDLETICLKCLQKEPGKRYSSALALADDLRTLLDGKPIKARPVRWPGRVARWCRRNPAVAAMTVAVAAMLMVGTATSTYFAVAADAEADRANREAAESKENASTAVEKARESHRRYYCSDLKAADLEWQAARITLTLQRLARHDPELADVADLRGFEWHYLKRACQLELRSLRGHTGGINAVALSPDGRRIVSASGNIIIRDTVTGEALLNLRGDEGIFYCVAFSPDGRQIAAGGSDNKVRVWDANSGREIRAIPDHSGASSVTFSPDGRYLGAACGKNTVRVYGATDGKVIRDLAGHTWPVESVAFRPDGRQIASAGGRDKTVKLWDVASGQEIHTLRGHTDSVLGVAFSPDGRRIVSASSDKTAKLWDTATGQEILTTRGHTSGVYRVAFSPDGRYVASASSDNTVRIWNSATGEEILTFRGHIKGVSGVTFSPDGRRLFTCSEDGTVKVWDVGCTDDALTLHGHRGGAIDVAFSPDGRLLASTAGIGTLRISKAASGQEIATLTSGGGKLFRLAFSPDGHRIAAGCADHTVKVWDLATGRESLTLAGHSKQVFGVAFSRDGSKLASGSFDHSVKLWDAKTGDLIRTFSGHNGEVFGIAFSPDGRRLASASDDKTAKVWDIAGGAEIFTIPADKRVFAVAFSRDGRRLATGDEVGTLTVWDAFTGQPIVPLAGHQDVIWGLTFSPDGRRLASSSRDNTVRLWDFELGQELLTLQHGHTEEVAAVAFSPDGLRLASASIDGTVKIWDGTPLRPDEPVLREARGLVDFLFDKPLPKIDVIAAIRADRTVSEMVRHQALALAQQYQDRPDRLNDESWKVVVKPDLDVAHYQHALKQAELACRLVPDQAACLKTLGVAKYRLGQFAEAVATLSKSEKLNNETEPADAAFLAMAQTRLGEKEKTQAELERLRTLMKTKKWSGDFEAQTLLREAEATVAERAN